jgi:hypothetical protein
MFPQLVYHIIACVPRHCAGMNSYTLEVMILALGTDGEY